MSGRSEIEVVENGNDKPMLVLPLSEKKAEGNILVILGASGDLTRRKLIPALAHLFADGALPEPFVIVGVSRTPMTDGQFRDQFRKSAPDGVWERFASRLGYLAQSYDNPSDFKALKEKLAEIDRREGTRGNRIFYLATPAELFPGLLRQLRASGNLSIETKVGSRPWQRIVIEKPFGRDLATAIELDRIASECASEEQVYRIDHYLGKETVQNILCFRFGNSIFEPIWNRKYIDHVQITAAEDLGVGSRGSFYDSAGALRDMVQNHLLQVLSVCAMEPPNSFREADVRSEKTQVLSCLRAIRPGDVPNETVRAQYAGYRNEPGVATDSRTPTYVAVRAMIDNWRWQGVPFYVRTGKALSGRLTEIRIQFQSIPLSLFCRDDLCDVVQPNILTILIQPREGISLRFVAKVPGETSLGSVRMKMHYHDAFRRPIPDAYERLLLDVMRGDATHFARADTVEAAWRFCTPILEAWDQDRDPKVPQYAQGTAGPEEADALIGRDGRSWAPLVKEAFQPDPPDSSR